MKNRERISRDSRLNEMLTFKRPHGTNTEKKWVKRYIMPHNPHVFADRHGEHMAYAVEVRRLDMSDSKILFSAHVDTMHQNEGVQILQYDRATCMYSKADKEPLGADDTAGVWLMLEMIDAGIPGVYLFHRGEERGCIGSGWMADNQKNWLRTFNVAIAFDRKGLDSVITHQRNVRCCSDVFADALADQLNMLGDLMYAPDDTGVYTDTAEYTQIIPECTNVSVGYYEEHTSYERLNWLHLRTLREVCLQVDWESLPVKRDPSVIEEKPWKFGSYFGTGWGKEKGKSYNVNIEYMSRNEMDDMAYTDPETFVDLVREYMFGEVPGSADAFDVEKVDDDGYMYDARTPFPTSESMNKNGNGWTDADLKKAQDDFDRRMAEEQEREERELLERVRNFQ